MVPKRSYIPILFPSHSHYVVLPGFPSPEEASQTRKPELLHRTNLFLCQVSLPPKSRGPLVHQKLDELGLKFYGLTLRGGVSNILGSS